MKLRKAVLSLLAIIVLLATVTACTDSEDNPIPCAETLITQIEDVSPDDWFYRRLMDGLRFGLITADEIDNNLFDPDRDVTQGEFITMLGRLHEYGHGTIGTPDDGPIYERYIEWALENGIVHSYKYWDLMPQKPINREQKVVILYQYFALYDLWDYVQFEHGTLTEVFRDYLEISYWARRPVEIFRTNFMTFRRDGYFNPHNAVSRAEALALLVQINYAIYG